MKTRKRPDMKRTADGPSSLIGPPPDSVDSPVNGQERLQCRTDRLQRLSPERRATFERIRKLREQIGPIGFNISSALREIRQGG